MEGLKYGAWVFFPDTLQHGACCRSDMLKHKGKWSLAVTSDQFGYQKALCHAPSIHSSLTFSDLYFNIIREVVFYTLPLLYSSTYICDFHTFLRYSFNLFKLFYPSTTTDRYLLRPSFNSTQNGRRRCSQGSCRSYSHAP